jgi:hypothetical protein
LIGLIGLVASNIQAIPANIATRYLDLLFIHLLFLRP